MRKSYSQALFWSAVVQVMVTAPCLWAESIRELAPSRVIELVRPTASEEVPVVSSVALDPAGDLLVTAGDDHVVRIWDARQGQVLRRLAAHTDWVQSAAFSPDGRTLATAGHDRRITLWAITADRPLRTLPEHLGGISALVFTPDGRTLAAAGF